MTAQDMAQNMIDAYGKESATKRIAALVRFGAEGLHKNGAYWLEVQRSLEQLTEAGT